MVFEKGRGRKKKKELRWEEEDIEEVKEKLKYLEYNLQKWRDGETYKGKAKEDNDSG